MGEAIALSAEIGEADVRTRALIDVGLVLHEVGETATAGERLRAALDLAETTDNTYERARALAALSKVEHGLQDYAVLARKLFEQLGVAEAQA